MVGGFVEGAGHNLGLHAALHIGHFLRALVDEKHDFVDLRMIVRDCVGYALEEHGLTGFGLGDDESALALAYRREHVHYAAGRVGGVGTSGEVELLVREERGEEVKGNAVTDEFRLAAVHHGNLYQREVFVAFARRTDLSGNGVAVLEGVLLDLLLGDIDVVGRIEVVVVRTAEEAIAVGHDFQHAGGHNRALELGGLRFWLIVLVILIVLAVLLILLALLVRLQVLVSRFIYLLTGGILGLLFCGRLFPGLFRLGFFLPGGF